MMVIWHFRRCESQFMRSSSRNNNNNLSSGMNLTIKKVIYVINPKLIKSFINKKNELKNKCNNNLNIILAWHGTSKNNLDDIVENNFNMSIIGRGSYGKGIYFSEYANISQGYGDGLLLCKVILGKSYKMKKTAPGIGLKKGYHSHIVHNSSQKYGDEIVIFDVNQILPCYIVKY